MEGGRVHTMAKVVRGGGRYRQGGGDRGGKLTLPSLLCTSRASIPPWEARYWPVMTRGAPGPT